MKNSLVLGAVIVVIFIISSATAVPCVQSQPVMDSVEHTEKCRSFLINEPCSFSNLDDGSDETFHEIILKVKYLVNARKSHSTLDSIQQFFKDNDLRAFNFKLKSKINDTQIGSTFARIQEQLNKFSLGEIPFSNSIIDKQSDFARITNESMGIKYFDNLKKELLADSESISDNDISFWEVIIAFLDDMGLGWFLFLLIFLPVIGWICIICELSWFFDDHPEYVLPFLRGLIAEPILFVLFVMGLSVEILNKIAESFIVQFFIELITPFILLIPKLIEILYMLSQIPAIGPLIERIAIAIESAMEILFPIIATVVYSVFQIIIAVFLFIILPILIIKFIRLRLDEEGIEMSNLILTKCKIYNLLKNLQEHNSSTSYIHKADYIVTSIL